MNQELREKASAKMLKEMEAKHSPSIDRIHNWLSDQDDEQLYEGILKDGKTIAGAFEHCYQTAKKHAENNVYVVDDAVVYSWVREYFTTDTPAHAPANMKAIKATKAQIDADIAADESEEEIEADDDQEDAPVKEKKHATVKRPAPAKKPTKKELAAKKAAEEDAKAKAATEAKERERKANHAPVNQTSIFDFTE